MIKAAWSRKETQELEDILECWHKKNRSFCYSNKILLASDKAIKPIKLHSVIGIETNHRNVKMRLIINRFERLKG